MRLLVIGGTRNIGHHLIMHALARGHQVTTFNRGRTPDELPDAVERRHGDRTDAAQLAAAVRGRTFDAVMDTAAYCGRESREAVEILNGSTGHYVHLSTGQVYLVLQSSPTPARETDYEGVAQPEPARGSADYEDWKYGVDKRACEAVLAEAWDRRRFPATRLRLPMIHGERDHYRRIFGYMLRLLDGAPMLVPEEGNRPIRHIDQTDVTRMIMEIIEGGLAKGEAYNLAQDDTWTLDDFLRLLSRSMGVSLRIQRVPRAWLEEEGFLPGCSPFSGRWMSVLDNTRAREVLGFRFTPMDQYVPRIVEYYRRHPVAPPESYKRRAEERALAAAAKDTDHDAT